MPDYLVLPRAREVRGSIRVPPSKSATNRALVLAALSPAPVRISRPLDCGDADALIACLAAMGVRIARLPDGLDVSGPPAAASGQVLLDARDSGTAARFLAGLAAAVPGRFRLDGSARLRERPMGALVDALRSAGAEIAFAGRAGVLPLDIVGGRLRSGEIVVDGRESSQFFSALLLAAVGVDGGLAVRPAGAVVSAPYVAMTVESLRAFGHRVAEGDGGTIRVARGSGPAAEYAVPGDDSSAVALLAAAAAGGPGSRVAVEGVSRSSSAPDARAYPVLERFGLALASVSGGIEASFSKRELSPVAVEASDFPDAVPVLAAVAALAAGESRISGIGHLRLKESDRISALEALVSRTGAEAQAGESDLTIRGVARSGAAAILPTFRDHRIAMAAGLLSLSRGGYLVEDPGCVAKSYPAFFRDLASLSR